MTDQLCGSVLLEKLTVPQPVKKFPAFYEIWKLLIVNSKRAISAVLGEINPVDVLPCFYGTF